jgi:hypothetical protein
MTITRRAFGGVASSKDRYVKITEPKRLPLLHDIAATGLPRVCDATWDDMVGSDRVRACARCERQVFNLSSMTSEEAEATLRSGLEEGARRPCIVYEVDAKGRLLILSSDERAPSASGRKRVFFAAVVVAAALPVAACDAPPKAQPARAATVAEPEPPASSTPSPPASAPSNDDETPAAPASATASVGPGPTRMMPPGPPPPRKTRRSSTENKQCGCSPADLACAMKCAERTGL